MMFTTQRKVKLCLKDITNVQVNSGENFNPEVNGTALYQNVPGRDLEFSFKQYVKWTNENKNYDKFTAEVKKHLEITDDIKIFYLDESNDIIPIESDIELKEAINIINLWKKYEQSPIPAMNNMGPDVFTVLVKKLTNNQSAEATVCGASESQPVEETTTEEEFVQATSGDIEVGSSDSASVKTESKKEMKTDEVPQCVKDYMKEVKAEILSDVIQLLEAMRSDAEIELPKSYKRNKNAAKGDNITISGNVIDHFNQKIRRKLEKLQKKEKRLDHCFEKVESKKKKILERASSSQKCREQALFSILRQCMNDDHVVVGAEVPGGINSSTLYCGSKFQKSFRIINVGTVAWTDMTELRIVMATGGLIPDKTVVPCPHLMPGEEGKMAIGLTAPNYQSKCQVQIRFFHMNQPLDHGPVSFEITVVDPCVAKSGQEEKVQCEDADSKLSGQLEELNLSTSCEYDSEAESDVSLTVVMDEPYNDKEDDAFVVVPLPQCFFAEDQKDDHVPVRIKHKSSFKSGKNAVKKTEEEVLEAVKDAGDISSKHPYEAMEGNIFMVDKAGKCYLVDEEKNEKTEEDSEAKQNSELCWISKVSPFKPGATTIKGVVQKGQKQFVVKFNVSTDGSYYILREKDTKKCYLDRNGTTFVLSENSEKVNSYESEFSKTEFIQCNGLSVATAPQPSWPQMPQSPQGDLHQLYPPLPPAFHPPPLFPYLPSPPIQVPNFTLFSGQDQNPQYQYWNQHPYNFPDVASGRTNGNPTDARNGLAAGVAQSRPKTKEVERPIKVSSPVSSLRKKKEESKFKRDKKYQFEFEASDKKIGPISAKKKLAESKLRFIPEGSVKITSGCKVMKKAASHDKSGEKKQVDFLLPDFTGEMVTATAPPQPEQPPTCSTSGPAVENTQGETPQADPVHILPETLINGAINVAQSTYTTTVNALSSLWPNGNIPSDLPVTDHEKMLRGLTMLKEMGFTNCSKNAELLSRYKYNIAEVVENYCSSE